MRHHLIFAVVIATLFAVPAFAQTAPSPPGVAAGAATNVALATATVPGTVDPNRASTTYHVEYGTTTSYGLNTSTRSAGSGDDPVTISVNLTGLTADTTYHFRVVAMNAAGIGRSADRVLRTTRPARPQPPTVRTEPVRDLAARTVTLAGLVNPRGLSTRYRFEYGTGTSVNHRTALVAAGAGPAVVPVSLPLKVSPDTRYSYRVVAINSAGTVFGARRSFTSLRAPAALTFAIETSHVPYEGTAVVTGSATSAGAGGVTLTLERQLFPYAGAFEPVGRSQRSAANGTYRFAYAPLLLSTRLRVVARTSPVVTSAFKTVRSTVRVGLAVARSPNRRLRFSGEVRPALSSARVSLQRRVRGRFVTSRRTTVRSSGAGAGGLRYRISIRARRTAAVYRVIVTPLRSSGHSRGISRAQRVAGLRRP